MKGVYVCAKRYKNGWQINVLYNVQFNLLLPGNIHNSAECVNKYHNIWGCVEDRVIFLLNVCYERNWTANQKQTAMYLKGQRSFYDAKSGVWRCYVLSWGSDWFFFWVSSTNPTLTKDRKLIIFWFLMVEWVVMILNSSHQSVHWGHPVKHFELCFNLQNENQCAGFLN